MRRRPRSRAGRRRPPATGSIRGCEGRRSHRAPRASRARGQVLLQVVGRAWRQAQRQRELRPGPMPTPRRARRAPGSSRDPASRAAASRAGTPPGRRSDASGRSSIPAAPPRVRAASHRIGGRDPSTARRTWRATPGGSISSSAPSTAARTAAARAPSSTQRPDSRRRRSRPTARMSGRSASRASVVSLAVTSALASASPRQLRAQRIDPVAASPPTRRRRAASPMPASSKPPPQVARRARRAATRSAGRPC